MVLYKCTLVNVWCLGIIMGFEQESVFITIPFLLKYARLPLLFDTERHFWNTLEFYILVKPIQTTSKAQILQALTLILILGVILSISKWSEAY